LNVRLISKRVKHLDDENWISRNLKYSRISLACDFWSKPRKYDISLRRVVRTDSTKRDWNTYGSKLCVRADASKKFAKLADMRKCVIREIAQKDAKGQDQKNGGWITCVKGDSFGLRCGG
jgi:hypothetical protein